MPRPDITTGGPRRPAPPRPPPPVKRPSLNSSPNSSYVSSSLCPSSCSYSSLYSSSGYGEEPVYEEVEEPVYLELLPDRNRRCTVRETLLAPLSPHLALCCAQRAPATYCDVPSVNLIFNFYTCFPQQYLDDLLEDRKNVDGEN